MLQSLASRTARRNTIYYKVRSSSRTNHHLGRVDAPLLGRPALVSGGYGYGGCSYDAPGAVLLSVRHYAQQTPPGGGQGGGGGIPGFKFPVQQQYAKGDALKEFVRVACHPFSFFFFLGQAFIVLFMPY